MDARVFEPDAPKKSVNLSINSDLLGKARALRVNMSQVLEMRLAELLREEQGRRWQEENREAIEAYNRRVEAHGSFGDGVRRF